MSKKLSNVIIIILSMVIVGIISYLFLFSNKTIDIESITLNKNKLTLVIGTREKLEVDITPADAMDKTLIWESSNSNIADVTNDGEVIANNIGSTVISVKSENGIAKDQCIVYVEKKKIDVIEIDKTNINLLIGDKETLMVDVYPEELINDIIWTSSDSSVVRVENGEIEAISEGVATVTVTSVDGSKSAECIVNVSSPIIKVTDITLRYNDIIMVNGSKEVLSATISPSDATDKTLIWSSSNPDVVSVENGQLMANQSGTSTITVTTIDGDKKATCNVRVVPIKTHNQQNDAITEYFNNPNNIKAIYRNCKSKGCTTPNKYITSLTGDINIYQYNLNNNTKDLIVTTMDSNINDYLLPNKIYYLESKGNTNNVEVVKITGSLRTINASNISNFRDLGGWTTEEGTTIKYGKIYRSASSDRLSDETIKILNLKRVVDLRGSGEVSIKIGASLKSIRQIISITQYSTAEFSKVRIAITEIMNSIVENKNVLFNCAIGRDRTGSVAFIIEGILGVTLENRQRDYEISYFTIGQKIRTDASFQNLINQFNKYEKTRYDQERFINWYLSTSSNKGKDLELINKFRKKMIDGEPKEYKLVNDKIV